METAPSFNFNESKLKFAYATHLPAAAYPTAPELEIEPGYTPPAIVDNRSLMLPSSNQGETPQCVAYAIAGRVEMERWQRRGDARQIDPSPIYHAARQIDGLPSDVDGTIPEAALQAAVNLHMMSYAPGSLRRIHTLPQLQRAIHRDGCVVACFGITTEWFKTAEDGWIAPGGEFAGFHAVLLTGYDIRADHPHFVAGQNSWGSIGWRGHFRLSLDAFATQFNYALTWNSLTS